MTKREALDIAYSVFDKYRDDPVHTMHRLITLYGRRDAEKVVAALEEACPPMFDDAA